MTDSRQFALCSSYRNAVLFLDLYDIRVGTLVYAKLGRHVCRENDDITHSAAEMVVVLVLFHPYYDTFLIYGLAAFCFQHLF